MISFSGFITELNYERPEYGGSDFLVEVTLADKSKAYVMPGETYEEMYNDIRADRPGGPDFLNDLYVKMPAYGEYVLWKGRNVIVSIEIGFPDDE